MQLAEDISGRIQHLILSRKGFDSSAGKGSSPLLVDDGRLISLPIPESPSRRPTATTRYADLRIGNLSYLDLLRSLYPRRPFAEETLAHLDPDLATDLPGARDPIRFRGLFGQVGVAAAHLRNQDVAAGDVFLFFGRFRRAERDSTGRYRFLVGERAFHAIFGYLEVDERIDDPALAQDDGRVRAAHAFAPAFPHFLPTARPRPLPETVYIARKRLSFAPSLPGFGVFRFRKELRLTRADASAICEWSLPLAFNSVDLSYNPRTERRRWRISGESVHFLAASRGQEFVAPATVGVTQWAQHVILTSSRWHA